MAGGCVWPHKWREADSCRGVGDHHNEAVPLRYKIDPARRLVHVQTEGVVQLAEILDYLDAVAVKGAMPYAKLFDASCGDMVLSDDDMMVLGARVSAYARMEPRGPVALVVGSDETNALARRFANLGGAKRPARIFKHADEARAWLTDEMAR